MVGRMENVMKSIKNNRKFVLAIVYVAILLDNVLLTAIVPILPEFLFRLEHPNDTYLESTLFHPNGFHRLDNKTNERNVYTRINLTVLDFHYLKNRKAVELTRAHQDALWSGENIKIGIMLGSKSVTQFIINLIIGPLTNRIGFSVPMFVGFGTLLLSTLIFAFGTNYCVLLIARAMQGVGSACTTTSGMGLLAQLYTDDKERGAAMGVALGGLGLGVLIGPPFGGILYKFGGKELPFLILAAVALLDGILQLLVLKPTVEKDLERVKATSLGTLLKDPYIIIAAGGLAVENLGIAVLEPSLPIWMIETMGSDALVRGVTFMPGSICYLIGVNLYGPLAHKIGRWLSSLVGMVVAGGSLIAIPFATNVVGIIVPLCFCGFAMAAISSSLFPLMGQLVDRRHSVFYGNVYAIADAAFCLAFAFGPFISGLIVQQLGFAKLMFIVATITLTYAPLLMILRKPTAKRNVEIM